MDVEFIIKRNTELISPNRSRILIKESFSSKYLVLFGYQLLVVTMPKHRFTTRAVNGHPHHSSLA
ncbi:hypothetical protein EQG58_15225 [Lactiplantibacillus plantarum]|nr:hypothetical protein EQG58_15225 [Lactiplantibacillus plantarum]